MSKTYVEEAKERIKETEGFSYFLRYEKEFRAARTEFIVYGVPKRNADRPAWGNRAAAGGNVNRWK